MYCPTCGTEASTNQKFCRSCGMELQIIFQLVAKHVSATDPALLREAKPSVTERITGSLEPIVHKESQVHE